MHARLGSCCNSCSSCCGSSGKRCFLSREHSRMIKEPFHRCLGPERSLCMAKSMPDEAAEGVMEELSEARHVIIESEFTKAAEQLRGVFDSRFDDPRKTMRERFLWDYWHVPGQYTLHRTQVGARSRFRDSCWPEPVLPGSPKRCAQSSTQLVQSIMLHALHVELASTCGVCNVLCVHFEWCATCGCTRWSLVHQMVFVLPCPSMQP